MMNYGKILRVNLSTGEVKTEEISKDLVKNYMGGLGFVAHFLYKEVPKNADPLGEENKIIIAPGALTGFGIPTASKTTLAAKSPLTGGFGRTVVGAPMGPELRKAGYAVMIIEGKSEKPVVIHIENENVSIEPAEELWGMDTKEAQKKLKEKYGKVSTAVIGPAGENLSKISGVDFEERQAARTGIGAVFGSKNLKGIAVRGTLQPEVADKGALMKLIAKWAKIIKEHPATKDDMGYGSGEFLRWMNLERGTFPTRNWQWGYFQSFYDNAKEDELLGIDPYYWVPKYRDGRNPCPNCTKPCSQVFKLTKYREGEKVDGPEYETLYSLGSELEISDPEAVAYLNLLCDLYGLDTISAGVTIGWAMEAYERGLLTKEDTDGIELKFGDVEAAAEALRRMAYREGKLGELLADGSKAASEKLGKGSEKFAIHVKGMELPAYDVRGIKGMALAIAVSYRGACHLTAGVYGTELVGKWWKFEGIDRLSAENKGYEIKAHEDLMQVYDATGLCKFSRHMYLLEGIPELLKAVTGIDYSYSDIMTVGERIYNVARAFNVREGLSRKDDKLPWRITHDPIPKGKSAGAYVKEEELEHMLDEYYQARGWSRDGVPTKVKLVSLDLEDLADEIGAGH
ncbi:MAG: aldehyde ferredoxin oxidoreductase family protein, partial [Euryarchaeota archaeon]|nr:aldehyde ferredoxin oxidoreductase family protein [Euryarchaeota archaeon]